MLNGIILIDLVHYSKVNDNLCHGNIQSFAFKLRILIKEFLTAPMIEMPDRNLIIMFDLVYINKVVLTCFPLISLPSWVDKEN